MANSYCTIIEPGGLTKKFKALKFTPFITPGRVEDLTVGGDVDISYGASIEGFQMTFRVPIETTDTSYGTLDDLTTIIRRNNPSIIPSPLFNFIDHYGNYHINARFGTGKIDLESATVIIDGVHAIYIVPVTVMLTPNNPFNAKFNIGMVHCYTSGIPTTSSSSPCYTTGNKISNGYQPIYTRGSGYIVGLVHSFIPAGLVVSNGQDAYTKGKSTGVDNASAYIVGNSTGLSNKAAYTSGT